MELSHGSPDLQAFPALRRSYRRGDRAKALKDATRKASELEQAAAPREHPAGTPFVPLEVATLGFRDLKAREYRSRAAGARDAARASSDLIALALSVPDFPIDERAIRDEEAAALRSAHWYEGRAGAQLPRFDTIRNCGEGGLVVQCRPCNAALSDTPIPCRCGVVRVCKACADYKAKKREQRLAMGRAYAVVIASDLGLFLPGRQEGLGVWSEKMLTLSAPHVGLEDIEPGSEIAKACEPFGLDTTINVRLAAIRLAWPRFMRSVRRFVQKREGKQIAKAMHHYRFLEWTEGKDGHGHPHFHVYWLSPWIDWQRIREWWAIALEQVGLTIPRTCDDCETPACKFVPGSPHVITHICRLYGFAAAQLRELLKRGDRKAIEHRLGPLTDKPKEADNVTRYANGWTMAAAFNLACEDDVSAQRDVYCALEGRRMCQGSRGFLPPLVKSVCATCHASMFAAHVVNPCASEVERPPVERVRFHYEDRGPPCNDAAH